MLVGRDTFKALYNILLEDSLVDKALELAHQYVKHKVSKVYEKEIVSSSVSNKHSFYLPTGYWIMDSDFNNTLSPNDLTVREFNTQTYEDSDISSLITQVRQFKYANANRLIVTFSEDVPHNNYNSLYFRFYITPLNLNDEKYKKFIKEFITLYAFKNLLNYVDLDKLQAGIATYNLNGVTLTVDSSTIRQVIEDIEKKINYLYNEFMPVVFETFSGAKDTSTIYFAKSIHTFIR